MVRVVETEVFREWLQGLRDRGAVARINTRILRLRLGKPGDTAPVGEGVSELRLMFGPGYRVYYAMEGQTLIILLAGGDKSTQSRDVARAKDLLHRWREDRDR